MAKRKRKPKAAADGPLVPPLPPGVPAAVILQLFRSISLLSNYIQQINDALVQRNVASAQQLVGFANQLSAQLQSIGEKNPAIQIWLSALSLAISQRQSLGDFLTELGSYQP